MNDFTTPTKTLSKTFNIKDFKCEQKTIIRSRSCYSSKLYDVSSLIDENYEATMRQIMEELIKDHDDHRIFCVERNITILPNAHGDFNHFEFAINFDGKKIIWQKPTFWYQEAPRAFDSPIIGGCDLTRFDSINSKGYGMWEDKVE